VSKFLELLVGDRNDTLRKRIQRFGWFELLWTIAVVGFCIYLASRDWHWWQIAEVGLFGLWFA